MAAPGGEARSSVRLMPFRERHYRWQWDLASPPAALWPWVADTNRFNRDTGVPPIDRVEGAGPPLRNARRRLRLFKLGLPVEWEEDPFEWVWPHRFGVVRRYRRGPVAEMRVLAELAERAGGGSRLVYQVWARPRNVLGLLAVPVEIGVRCARTFEAAVRGYDRQAAAGRPAIVLPAEASLAPGAAARLRAIRETLVRQGGPPDLVERLIDTVERADDVTVARLRPYALADQWGEARRPVLELCLLATRAGLLDFRWELLCPLCRGAQVSSGSLRDVEADVHCESCHIGFTADFDRLVELTFRPNATVREVESREFCIGGPQVTPHVVAQQLLPPGSSRALSLALEPGRYRLRALELPGGLAIRVGPDGAAEAAVAAAASGWPRGELALAPVVRLALENATDGEQLLILERMAWSDQAATAAEVIVLQLFRDLFASEALRPRERISVGSLAVVFTDLTGSTRLYREIGDAPAFGRVMSHFDVLKEVVAREGGSIVKTMGDAIMAVFGRPAAALHAMLAAQATLASPGGATPPLGLKVGIHAGPCIAVTLNERLDYFGSVVNMAARLEGFSTGADVVVSAAVRNDPEVAELLAREETSAAAERFEATLKGFDAERFELWRVRR